MCCHRSMRYCCHMTSAASTPAQQNDAPLDHLDEKLVHDGAQWFAEGAGGGLYLIRWFGNTGNVVAWRAVGLREVNRGTAQAIEQARAEALRMAGLIATGKKG